MIHYTNFNRVVSAIEVYLRVFVRGLFPAVCATLATKGFFLWQKSYMKPPRRPLNYYTEFLKKVSLIILLLLPQLSAKKLSGFLIISLALIHEKQRQKLLYRKKEGRNKLLTFFTNCLGVDLFYDMDDITIWYDMALILGFPTKYLLYDMEVYFTIWVKSCYLPQIYILWYGKI